VQQEHEQEHECSSSMSVSLAGVLHIMRGCTGAYLHRCHKGRLEECYSTCTAATSCTSSVQRKQWCGGSILCVGACKAGSESKLRAMHTGARMSRGGSVLSKECQAAAMRTILQKEAMDGLVEVEGATGVAAAEHSAQCDAFILCEASDHRQRHACAHCCCMLVSGSCSADQSAFRRR
jgi:hypothetical protein